jgi:glycosyltransferase involved in cell wall biosynthesis
VPDVRPWLRRAEVYACPMVSGTGIKNKLLEALACGAACVATPLACRGLNLVDDEHLLVSEDAEGLARAVFRLLEDASLRRRLGDAGRRYVLEHHTWEATAAAYERLYEQAASA